MTLSIVIPCFNQAHFLKEALEGFEQFKVIDFDVIIVNDGSTNNSTLTEIEEVLKETSFPVKVIHQENCGLAEARNKAIECTNAKYILPLDADNKLVPAFVLKAIQILETDTTVAIVHGNPVFFGDTVPSQRLFETGAFDFLKMINYNYVDACAVFRKEVWIKNKGYDKNMPAMGHEDWEFWIHAYVNQFTFKYVPENAYHYRVHNTSMITKTLANLQANQIYILAKNFWLYHEVKKHQLEELHNSYNRVKNSYLADSKRPLRSFFKFLYRLIRNKNIPIT